MKKNLYRPLEIKSLHDDGTFEGYGSVFHNEDWYGDIVAPGAFKATLGEWRAKGALPPMCWQHNMDQVIGVYEEMEEDDRGLYLKGRLLKDDVALAREAYALIKAKAISGLSIGYRTRVDEYDHDNDTRTLKELELWEVSLVSMPANDLARVEAVKSIEDITGLERFLRDAGGVSRKEARETIHRLKASLRDAGGREAAMARLIENTIQTLRG